MRAKGVSLRALQGVSSRPRLADVQPGFGGGLNTTASDTELSPSQMRFCTNGLLSQFGDVTKRLGTRRLHSAAIASAPIRNGICWRTATTHEYLVACNGALYSGGVYSSNMTWTNKGALFTGTNYPFFAPFRDAASAESVYIADGGTFKKYSAGTLSAPAGATSGLTVLSVYNQRVFGVTGADQTLYYSALNDGDTIGTASGGSAVIRTFSSQKITGLLTLRGSLAIFHVSGISRFTGYTQDDIAIGAGTIGISTDTGTISPRSMIAVDGVGFFLSERGAYMVNEGGVQRMDTPASPDPLVPIMTQLAISDFEMIDVTYDKSSKTIRWTIPGTGVYLYHIPLNAWSGPWDGGYTDVVTHCLFDGLNASGLPITVVGGSDGFLRHCDYTGTYLDNVLYDGTGGTTYTLRIQCRRMYTSAEESEKAWRWAYLFADLRGTVTASFSWITNTGAGTFTLPATASGSIWGSFTWGFFTWGGSGAAPFRIPLGDRGTYIDITIADDGEAASVYSRVTLEAFDYGRRG